LEEVKALEIYAEVPAFVTEIDNELIILRRRLANIGDLPDDEGFQTWWLTHAH